MRESAFVFLRATYWRWAETIVQVCPELADATSVLAVGDIHIENFGTWRDADGRLTWGVNDFDEAAEMPYVLDLVRLAASALLEAAARNIPADDICSAILQGYRQGLRAPRRSLPGSRRSVDARTCDRLGQGEGQVLEEDGRSKAANCPEPISQGSCPRHAGSIARVQNRPEERGNRKSRSATMDRCR